VDARNLYIPSTSEEQAIEAASEPSDAADRLPKAVPLRLPSSLPATLYKSCPFNLTKVEFCFCLAQAQDALSKLRCLLCVTMSLRGYKLIQIGLSQHASTCAQNLISHFEDKVAQCVGQYRSAHVALLSLDPEGEWQVQLRQLSDTDIQAPDHADNESEGNWELL
jgi:hypothetical protein